MFTPFYVHINPFTPGKRSSKHPRGATLLVSPVKDDHRTCLVQGAWCSPKDAFCKKIGRETAAAAEGKVINKRQLPELVGTMEGVCHGYTPADTWWNGTKDYLHLLRNFL